MPIVYPRDKWRLIGHLAFGDIASGVFWGSGYRRIHTYYRGLASATGASLQLRLSTDGSTFDTGASDYTHVSKLNQNGSDNNVQSGGTSFMNIQNSALPSPALAVAAHGEIFVEDPSDTDFHCQCSWSTVTYLSGPGPVLQVGSGLRKSTSEILGLQVSLSSGTLSEGEMEVWGLVDG